MKLIDAFRMYLFGISRILARVLEMPERRLNIAARFMYRVQTWKAELLERKYIVFDQIVTIQ